MDDDRRDLRQLQLEIGRRESAGDRAGLDGLLAPAFAFRRADGSVVDRAGFLAAVKQSPARHTEVTAVTLHGDRAVVECVVTMDGKAYHNLRLFIRQGDEWKLLGWANEAASADPPPAHAQPGAA
jgi:hypothetical protein